MDPRVAPALIAFAVALAGTAALVPLLRRWRILDHPGARSSHDSPTPRGGGLAILLGIAAAAGVAAAGGLPLPGWRLVAGALAVAAVGAADDAVHTPWWLRLAVQLGAAALVVLPAPALARLPLPAPLDLPLGPLAPVVALVWIVAVVNFVNFLDGIDGIAGAQAAITAITLALVTAGPWRWLGWAVAAAALGFLVLNWSPARIFMGDVGSGTLGFLLAAAPFGAAGATGATVSIGATGSPLPGATGPASVSPGPLVTLVALSLWLFLADGSWVLVRRALRGERVWQAHRGHAYQRLVHTGLSHAQVAGGVALGAVVTSAAGLWAYRTGTPARLWIAFIVCTAVFLLELGLARARERRTAVPALRIEAAVTGATERL